MVANEIMVTWAISFIISLGANLTTEAGKKFIALFKDKPELSAKLEEITPGTFEGTPKARLRVALSDALNEDPSLLEELSAFAKKVDEQILIQEGSENTGIQERTGARSAQFMSQKGDKNRGRQSSS